MTFRLYAPWVHSLKEKRSIVKSLIAKLRNRYHVSAAEIDEQDTHLFVEENTDAEIIDEEREIR